MKNIIIFAGAGFIGTNLTKRLLDEGNKVLCIDNYFTGRLVNINQFLKNQNYLCWNADITDKETFEKIDEIIEAFFYNEPFHGSSMNNKHFHGLSMNNFVDEIYNLACPASPSKYQIDPIYTIHTSLAIEDICELAIKYNAKMLHSSTSEVYGDPDEFHHPQKETYRGNVNTMGPRACYDEGKRIAETIIYEYIKKGCKAKVIRIFNTYGPYMDPNDGRVVSNFICQMLRNEDVTIYGDGSQTRSFQYIDDLLDGMRAMMNTEDDFYGPVNIGSPYEFTMLELAELVFKLIPQSTSKIIFTELPKDDPKQRQADITKLKEKTGWWPKVELLVGLSKTIEYFRKELVK